MRIMYVYSAAIITKEAPSVIYHAQRTAETTYVQTNHPNHHPKLNQTVFSVVTTASTASTARNPVPATAKNTNATKEVESAAWDVLFQSGERSAINLVRKSHVQIAVSRLMDHARGAAKN